MKVLMTCTEVMGRLWESCSVSLCLPYSFEIWSEPGARLPARKSCSSSLIVDSTTDFLDECWELNSGPHTCLPSFISSPGRHLYFDNSLTFIIIYFVHMGTHAVVYIHSEDRGQRSGRISFVLHWILGLNSDS